MPIRTNYRLTPDFLRSQRASGATDTQIAALIAKNDPSFNTQYQTIQSEAARYNNPESLITSFLNYKVHGDATYQDTNNEASLNSRYDEPGPAGYSRNDILNSSNPIAAGAKTAANFGVGAIKAPWNVAKAAVGMAMDPRGAAEAAGTAISGGMADLYHGITSGINAIPFPTGHTQINTQFPSWKEGGEFGDYTTTGPTPEQVKFQGGFLNKTLGLSDALQGNFTGAADRITTNLITDPTSTALALSPLTHPATIDPATGLRIDPITGKPNPGILGPISTASDLFGKGIDYAAQKLKESADASIQATRQKFLRELVSPQQTAAVKEAQVARTTETGIGPFKKSVIAPSSSELASEEALMDVKGVSPSNTMQGNYNALSTEIADRATALKEGLALPENNFIVQKAELKGGLKRIAADLQDSPVLVGNAELSANKLIKKWNDLIDGAEGDSAIVHADTVLQLRKDYDTWLQSNKPKIFDQNYENALSVANRAIREHMNGILEKGAPNAAVAESLAGQHALYNARDTIQAKAAFEADTAVKRLFQKVQGKVGKVRLLSTGTVGAAGTLGLGVYLAPAIVPIAAGLGTAAFGAYEMYRFVASPKLRYALSGVLKVLEKAAITDPSVIPLIQETNTLIRGEIPNQSLSGTDTGGQESVPTSSTTIAEAPNTVNGLTPAEQSTGLTGGGEGVPINPELLKSVGPGNPPATVISHWANLLETTPAKLSSVVKKAAAGITEPNAAIAAVREAIPKAFPKTYPSMIQQLTDLMMNDTPGLTPGSLDMGDPLWRAIFQSKK